MERKLPKQRKEIKEEKINIRNLNPIEGSENN